MLPFRPHSIGLQPSSRPAASIEGEIPIILHKISGSHIIDGDDDGPVGTVIGTINYDGVSEGIAVGEGVGLPGPPTEGVGLSEGTSEGITEGVA